MSLIAPLLFLLGVSGTVALCFRRRFEEALPVALTLSALVCYVFGCAGALKAGYVACVACAAAFPALCVWKRRQWREWRALLLTPGLCAFLAIYFFAYWFNLDRGYTLWDEFSFWGIALKETVRTGGLHCFPAASVTEAYRGYPPIATIFEALWCFLCGGYRETYAYRALLTLLLCLPLSTLCAAPKGKGRGLIYTACGLLALLGGTLAVELGSADFYKSIYLDGLMAVLTAYCLWCVMADRERDAFSCVRLSAGLACLCLAKSMGVGLAALVMLLWLADERPRKLAKPLAVLGAPLALWGVWKLLCAVNHVGGGFSVHLSALPGIVAGSAGYEVQRQVLGKMARALLEKSLVWTPLSLSYLQLTLLFTALTALIGHWLRDVYPPRRTRLLTAAVLIGSLGYAAGTAMSYLFGFPEAQALSLASYSRYMGTWCLACALLLSMLCVHGIGLKARRGQSVLRPMAALLACLWVACIPSDRLRGSLQPGQNGWSMSAYCAEDAAFISERTEENARVFILAERTDGYALYNIHYQITPRACNEAHFSLGTPLDESDRSTVALSPQEWRAELAQYDYLYLYEADETFAREYAELFPAGAQRKQLYRVVKNEDEISLELVS